MITIPLCHRVCQVSVKFTFIEGERRPLGTKREFTGRQKVASSDGPGLCPLSQAMVALVGIGCKAPKKGDGYDKVDFVITWADGSAYNGRYDLVRGGHDDAGRTLQEHIEHSLREMDDEVAREMLNNLEWF